LRTEYIAIQRILLRVMGLEKSYGIRPSMKLLHCFHITVLTISTYRPKNGSQMILIISAATDVFLTKASKEMKDAISWNYLKLPSRSDRWGLDGLR
jgi:hypothetical protein